MLSICVDYNSRLFNRRSLRINSSSHHLSSINYIIRSESLTVVKKNFGNRGYFFTSPEATKLHSSMSRTVCIRTYLRYWQRIQTHVSPQRRCRRRISSAGDTEITRCDRCICDLIIATAITSDVEFTRCAMRNDLSDR